MKHKQLFAFLALALALGLGSVAMLSTYANDPTTAEACSADALQAFNEKYNAGATEITLDGKICPESNLTINRDLTLDLNGHDIVSEVANARVLDIQQGNVTVKGKGSVIASDPDGAAVRVYGSTDPAASNFTTVTISDGVNLVGGTNSYGLFVSYHGSDCQAYGVTVNLESGSTVLAGNGLYINGMMQHENGPTFNLADGAKVTAAQDGVAIYAAGYGTWNLNAAELTGGSVLGIKSGVANLKNTTMRATGNKIANTPDSDGINANGAAIQIEENDAYAGGVEIVINGGKYQSDKHAVFTAYDADSTATRALGDDFKLQIKGGEFISGDGVEVFDGSFTPQNTTISGGTFTSDVKEFLAANLTQDASGKVISSSAVVTPTDPDDDSKDDDKKPNAPSTDNSGKTPDTGVNNTSEISAVFTIGGLGIGVALIAIFALLTALRRSGKGSISVEVTRTPSQSSRKSTARSTSSKRKTASASSRKAASSPVKHPARSQGSTTRKTTKPAAKSTKRAKKA